MKPISTIKDANFKNGIDFSGTAVLVDDDEALFLDSGEVALVDDTDGQDRA